MATIDSEYGACLVSRNIYEKTGNLKWCIREESVKSVDNGWRFLSDIDTEEYLADNSNWCIVAFESVIEIEPAVLLIYDMPIGTDVALIREGKKRFFVNISNGKPLKT